MPRYRPSGPTEPKKIDDIEMDIAAAQETAPLNIDFLSENWDTPHDKKAPKNPNIPNISDAHDDPLPGLFVDSRKKNSTLASAGQSIRKFPYRKSKIVMDLFKGIVGMFFTITPVFVLDLGSIFQFILLVLAGLFSWFFVRAILHMQVVITANAQGLESSGLGSKFILWRDIANVKMRFWGSRRDSINKGMMTLQVSDENTTIAMDNRLRSFDVLVAFVAQLARLKKLDLDAHTRANFAAMGQLFSHVSDDAEHPQGVASFDQSADQTQTEAAKVDVSAGNDGTTTPQETPERDDETTNNPRSRRSRIRNRGS